MPNIVRSEIGPFCIVPLWVAEAVPPAALKVYVILAAKYADRDTGEAYPSRRTLAHDSGISDDTLDRSVKELKAAGALTVEARKSPEGDRTSNLYTVVYVRGRGRMDAGTVAAPMRGRGRMDAATSILTRINEPEPDNQSAPAAPGAFSQSLPAAKITKTRARLMTAELLPQFVTEFPTLDVAKEYGKFQDYLASYGGRGGGNKVLVDHVAAFRNWLRRVEEGSSPDQPRQRTHLGGHGQEASGLTASDRAQLDRWGVGQPPIFVLDPGGADSVEAGASTAPDHGRVEV